MNDEPNGEIVTASGASPRNIDSPLARDWASVGWLVALDLQMMRLSAPLQTLYGIAETIHDGRERMAEIPAATNRFRVAFDKLGRAFTNDAEQITQDAVAGTILTILWKHLAHLAYHIGLKPQTLRYGDTINGVPLTQVLYAIRGAEMHSMSWMFRDFKADKTGRDQIVILKAAGITPIPFHAYEALRIIAPNGLSSLLTSMIPIMHAMVAGTIQPEDISAKAANRRSSKVTPTPTQKKAHRIRTPRRR